MKTKRAVTKVYEPSVEEMKQLAELCGLTNDSYGTAVDDRLFAETVFTNSLDLSRKEYAAMEKDLNNFSIKGPGFEVYAWNDSGGYDYWTVKQEEDNYIQITVAITDYKQALKNVAAIKAAVNKADGHFCGYSRS